MPLIRRTRQPKAQQGRIMLKWSRQYPGCRKPLKAHRRILRPHEPIKRRPANNLETVPGEQPIEPAGGPGKLLTHPLRPFAVGIGSQPGGQSINRHRPIAEHTAHARGDLRSPHHKPQPKTRESIELAKGTKYNQVLRFPAARNIRNTRLRSHFRKRLIEDQHAASGSHSIVQLPQPIATDDTSIRIIRIDYDHCRPIRKRVLQL
jgi:hypothetical protein